MPTPPQSDARAPQPNPYAVLGLERRATQTDIKRAYFKLVREFPPEEHPEKFQEIRAAYERLKSVEERAAVDMFLVQAPPDTPKLPRGRYDVSIHAEDAITLAIELRLAELDLTRDFRVPDIG
jgi:curved DNA-binding protein CbpA